MPPDGASFVLTRDPIRRMHARVAFIAQIRLRARDASLASVPLSARPRERAPRSTPARPHPSPARVAPARTDASTVPLTVAPRRIASIVRTSSCAQNHVATRPPAHASHRGLAPVSRASDARARARVLEDDIARARVQRRASRTRRRVARSRRARASVGRRIFSGIVEGAEWVIFHGRARGR